MALRPRKVQGAIVIDEDIQHILSGKKIPLHDYLLETAEVANTLASLLTRLSALKKSWTIYGTFPGPTGMQQVDYLFADGFVVPLRQEQGYQERMLASSLCDGKTFAYEVERAYRKAWYDWIGGK